MKSVRNLFSRNKKSKAGKKAGLAPAWTAGKPDAALAAPDSCQLNDEWVPLPLKSKVVLGSDSYVFTFATPDVKKPLNLSTCACLLVRFQEDGEEGEEKKNIVRAYTPVSTNSMIGQFELMIKVYPEGKMTQHINALKVGDTLDFKHIKFNVKLQYPFGKKTIGMIVGGSGITPMIQALHAILGTEGDNTNVVLLYGSKTRDGIMAKETLDSWAKLYPKRLTVIHYLSQEPKDSGWTGEIGRITKAAVEAHFPAPGDDMMIFVCGPSNMYETFSGPRSEREKVTGILGELGYTTDHVYPF